MSESQAANAFSRGALYELLSNPIYIGEIRYKGVCHPGLHEAIIDWSCGTKRSCCCEAGQFGARHEQRNQRQSIDR